MIICNNFPAGIFISSLDGR